MVDSRARQVGGEQARLFQYVWRDRFSDHAVGIGDSRPNGVAERLVEGVLGPGHLAVGPVVGEDGVWKSLSSAQSRLVATACVVIMTTLASIPSKDAQLSLISDASASHVRVCG